MCYRMAEVTGPANTLKPSAGAAVEALHGMSIDVAMITGDNARTAAPGTLYPFFGSYSIRCWLVRPWHSARFRR